MSLDTLKLLVVILTATSLSAVSLMIFRDLPKRAVLLGLLVGLAFYSGIGSADASVSWQLLISYVIFSTVLVGGFYIFAAVFRPLNQVIGAKPSYVLEGIGERRYSISVVLVYLAICSFPLVWPEFKLHKLLAPEAPDLRALLTGEGGDGAEPWLHKLLFYARVLLTPFFLIALYRWRRRLTVLAAILLAVAYVDYNINNYISRGTLLATLSYVLLSVIVYRPEYRVRLALAAVVVVPTLVRFLLFYAEVRLGNDPSVVGVGDAFRLVFDVEFGFARDVGMPVLESNARIDLSKYLLWIVTLPLPKLFTGAFDVPQINVAITELVSGRTVGTSGWSVMLPGLVVESIYIYGPFLFWLHALFISALAAFLVRLLETTAQFAFVGFYVLVTLTYTLNRAGITAVLPLFLTGFLMLYGFIALCAMWRLKSPQ